MLWCIAVDLLVVLLHFHFDSDGVNALYPLPMLQVIGRHFVICCSEFNQSFIAATGCSHYAVNGFVWQFRATRFWIPMIYGKYSSYEVHCFLLKYAEILEMNNESIFRAIALKVILLSCAFRFALDYLNDHGSWITLLAQWQGQWIPGSCYPIWQDKNSRR